MLNNTNISNLILLTNVFAADLWWSSSNIQAKITLDKLTIVLHCFFIAEECWTFFFCVLLYRRDLLVLQPEVYSLNFLVRKGFYIYYK